MVAIEMNLNPFFCITEMSMRLPVVRQREKAAYKLSGKKHSQQQEEEK